MISKNIIFCLSWNMYTVLYYRSQFVDISFLFKPFLQDNFKKAHIQRLLDANQSFIV